MKKSLCSLRTAALLVSSLAVNSLMAATVTWSGLGADDNWSTALNWTGGTPGSANAIVFTDTDATGTSGPTGTPNNIVSASVAIQSLKYGNSNNFHTTQISLGSTLTVTGSVSPIMLVGTATDNGNTQTVYATMLGKGLLLVTNNSGIVSIYQGAATAGGVRRATLDLEGLDTFTAYVSQVSVSGGEGFQRSQATLKLAKTNSIYCGSPQCLAKQ